MQYLIEHSKENPKLAKWELLELLGKDKVHHLMDNFFLSTLQDPALLHRLAYAKNVFQIIFSSTRSAIFDTLENTQWAKLINGSFKVEIIKPCSLDVKEISSIIWSRLNNPKVKLNNPDNIIFFHKLGNEFYCSTSRNTSLALFKDRRAHKRPGFAPVSLDPRLARACVNLLGPKANTIIDPMCGTGGFLIEAGLMGLNVAGYDISEEMVDKCKKNMEFYEIKNFTLEQQDFFGENYCFDHLITDLPYGRNTRLDDSKKFLDNFIREIGQRLKKRAVVILPDNQTITKVLKKNRLKVLQQFKVYIHKSLTKRILLLEPN